MRARYNPLTNKIVVIIVMFVDAYINDHNACNFNYFEFVIVLHVFEMKNGSCYLKQTDIRSNVVTILFFNVSVISLVYHFLFIFYLRDP